MLTSDPPRILTSQQRDVPLNSASAIDRLLNAIPKQGHINLLVSSVFADQIFNTFGLEIM